MQNAVEPSISRIYNMLFINLKPGLQCFSLASLHQKRSNGANVSVSFTAYHNVYQTYANYNKIIDINDKIIDI